MMKKHYCYYVLVIVLAVFLTHPAFAAKCVRPNGNGGCYDNIQEAIDNVNPGGTVKVYPGIYYGYFDANKPGITIEGMGKKRTDVRIDSGGGSTNSINAAKVTLQNLTIQNSNWGLFIHDTGSNSRILNVNIFSVQYGFYIQDSEDILIKNCKILKCELSGVLGGGKRITVQNTTISGCGDHGILSTSRGDQLTVDGCTIKDSGLDLIHLEGSLATIRDNQLFKAGGRGIYVESDFVKVTGNLVRGTGSFGIYLNGEAPVIKKNTVMHAQGNGFNLIITGGDSKILNNLLSYNGGNGFHVISPSFLLFKKNKAFNNDDIGISLVGTGDKMIIENQSKYNNGRGFFVDNGTLENNIASENGTSGYVLNSDNTVIQNKAINNMETGFHVQVNNNLLRNNRAIGNLTHGIHVTGDFNDMINNTMLDSLNDKCDEGTPGRNTWTNNTYDTECP